MFRPVLEKALGRPPRWKGGRPPFDPVLKFRMLVLQSLPGLSREQIEYLVRDRLSWIRFRLPGPEDRVPDAHTLRNFREAMIAGGAFDDLFERLDRAITAAGYLPRGGQILDATLVGAPRQHDTDGGKATIREGRSAAAIWPDQPARARQKDVDGRWTVKYPKAKVRADGTKPLDIAIPVHGLQVPHLHRPDAWDHPPPSRHRCRPTGRGTAARGADRSDQHAALGPGTSAYRSIGNEAWLEVHGMESRIHRKKPRGRPMPGRTSRANAAKSTVRSKVEHVFAHRKARMRMGIRTRGIARAAAAITLADMAHDPMEMAGDGSTAGLRPPDDDRRPSGPHQRQLPPRTVHPRWHRSPRQAQCPDAGQQAEVSGCSETT